MFDYHRRYVWIQDKMERQGIDLIVYGSSPDIQYLTGSLADWRRSRDLRHPEDCLFLPCEGEPILMSGVYSSAMSEYAWVKDKRFLHVLQDFRLEVKKALKDLVSDPKRVAIGEYTWSNMTLAVQSLLKNAKFVDADGMLDELRMVKDAEELDLMRKASGMTDEAMEKIINEIHEGLSPRELSLNIEHEGRLRGAVDVSFLPTSVMYKTGTPPDDRQTNYAPTQGLEENTSIAFDVGFVLNGYCSDWGRSFYYGKPKKHISKAYKSLMNAVVEVTDMIGDEIKRTDEVFPQLERLCDKAGYGDYLRARHPFKDVGHQIGVECHENPWLRPEDKVEFRDGMVFCIEPKLWHRGEYNIRVEDMITVKNGKAESITKFDRVRFEL